MPNKILTYNPDTGQCAFIDYSERTVHTKHNRMYQIKTKRGYIIKVTSDHSLLTIGDETFFKKLSPQEALGKFVPVLYTINIPVVLDGTDFIEKQINSELNKGKSFLIVKYINNIERSKILLWSAEMQFIPKEITEDKIVIDIKGQRLIPQDNELIEEDKVRLLNPANPYLNISFNWDEVIEVQEIPREEITYDFSVDCKEAPYFLGNEILVYDTVMVHVPVSAEARQEALDKMLPSKNLEHPRTLDPMLMMRQEHIFGLYLASKDIPVLRKTNTKAESVTNPEELLTKIKMGVLKPNTPVKYMGQLTTAGIAIALSNLPPTLRDFNMIWDKKNARRIMSMLEKQYPEKYGYIVNLFKDLGGLYAYKLGATFKASDFDLAKMKKLRDTYFSKTDKALAKIDASNMSKKEKEEAIGQELRKAQAFASSVMESGTNTFHTLYTSGSKGSGGQVTQITVSPTVVSDPKNRLIPSLIRHSYLEGLSPADYFTSSYGTRKGSVSAKLSVAPSGALSKEILGNTLDIVVSEKNCGTANGLTRNINDRKNILYRYEAKTNKFIDPNYYEQLLRQGKQEIVVRSPATCECRDGVCQYCFGYTDKMRLPDIGQNVGVEATHAVSEPLTQMGLSSKHTAGTAAGDTVDFRTIKSFYNMSSKFSGSAVISEVSGKITKIEPAPAGGTNVFVEKKKYYLPPGRASIVIIGQEIKAGDPLSNGITPYSVAVPHIGIEEGRKRFINEASDLYNKAGFGTITKNVEVISRGLINYVQIQDPGDFDEYAEGDVVDYNRLMGDIRKKPGRKKPTFTPVQAGTNKAPLWKNDWLGNFGFKFLKGQLVNNAATFAKSLKHSYNPIPSYARGNTFGKGENGQY